MTTFNGRQLLNIHHKGAITRNSDNGGITPKNGSLNTPLRGLKGQFFEGGIRIPFMVQWKGVIPAGGKYTNPVMGFDCHAMALAAAGISVPKDQPIDGVDLVPYLTGKNDGQPHEQLFWRKFDQDAISIRKGNLKLVADSQRSTKGYKLFDLSKDIGEKEDLFSKNPETADQLIEECDQWNSQLKPTAFPTLMSDTWWER